jgi:Domain of unknown function (DUF4214)/RTX calcium-binding nonapeptide repeat (4 copies)
MGYIEQTFYGQTINNLLPIKTLGNLTGGSFTAGSATSWSTGAASGNTVIFNSAISNSNVTNLRAITTGLSVSPSIVSTDGSGAVTETALVTFGNLAARQTILLDGLTFTAGAHGATAAQLASAFANIKDGMNFGSINTIKSLGDLGGGTFTAGSALGWNAGIATTSGLSIAIGTANSSVLFSSTTLNADVINLTSIIDQGGSLPTFSKMDGIAGTSTETTLVSFQSLASGQILSMEGLQFTAGSSGATAVQVGSAFAGVVSGISANQINLSKSLGDATGGVFTGGTASGWNAGTGTSTVLFTSTTTNANVADLTGSLTITASTPNIVVTNGSSASNETALATFNNVTAGDTITLAGLTFTAGAFGATSIQVASAFSNIASGATADAINTTPLIPASAYVVTPSTQTNANSLYGYMTSPVDGKTYTFLASGSFSTVTANTTISAVKGSVTEFKLFSNSVLMNSISYGSPVDNAMFGVTDSLSAVMQRVQATTQFNYLSSLLDSGAIFTCSSATNGGNDQVKGGSGNDIFSGNTGNDYFDGKAGFNLAIYRGLFKDYTVTSVTTTDRTDPGMLSQIAAKSISDSSVGRDGIDTLVNVQRAQFADGMLAFDVAPGQNAGEIYRLYQAALARTPDTSGIKYQLNDLEINNFSLWRIASNFLASPEFASKYGQNPTDTQYINALYNNVLKRTPGGSEVAWYQNQFNTKAMDRQAALIGFSESPENVALVGSAIANGIWLG